MKKLFLPRVKRMLCVALTLAMLITLIPAIAADTTEDPADCGAIAPAGISFDPFDSCIDCIAFCNGCWACLDCGYCQGSGCGLPGCAGITGDCGDCECCPWCDRPECVCDLLWNLVFLAQALDDPQNKDHFGVALSALNRNANDDGWNIPWLLSEEYAAELKKSGTYTAFAAFMTAYLGDQDYGAIDFDAVLADIGNAIAYVNGLDSSLIIVLEYTVLDGWVSDLAQLKGWTVYLAFTGEYFAELEDDVEYPAFNAFKLAFEDDQDYSGVTLSNVVTDIYAAIAAVVGGKTITYIDTVNILGLVAPVRGAAPVALSAVKAATDTAEYEIEHILWVNESWEVLHGNFAASTVYWAAISIRTKGDAVFLDDSDMDVSVNTGTLDWFASGLGNGWFDVGIIFPATGAAPVVIPPAPRCPACNELLTACADRACEDAGDEPGDEPGTPSGSIDAEVTDGTAAAGVTEDDLAGLDDDDEVFTITVDAGEEEVHTVEVSIPENVLERIIEAEVVLTIETPVATLTLDADVLAVLSEKGGDITVTAAVVDDVTELTANLTPGDLRKVEDRPVYSFSIYAGEERVSHWQGGKVTVAVPYELKEGENPNAIVVYYIDTAGRLRQERGRFNAETGMVTFQVTHFSGFVITYNFVEFTDIDEDHGNYDAIVFIAARGITVGMGDGSFGPDSALTRAQLLAMIMRAFGIEAEEGLEEYKFDDAQGRWYDDYTATARKLGITFGIGNNLFGFDRPVTREEMMLFVYRSLGVLGELDLLAPSEDGKDLDDFEDAGDISNWVYRYEEVYKIEAVLKSGIYSGDELLPRNGYERALMAQLLFDLLTR
jgi:hypothetical protein